MAVHWISAAIVWVMRNQVWHQVGDSVEALQGDEGQGPPLVDCSAHALSPYPRRRNEVLIDSQYSTAWGAEVVVEGDVDGVEGATDVF